MVFLPLDVIILTLFLRVSPLWGLNNIKKVTVLLLANESWAKVGIARGSEDKLDDNVDAEPKTKVKVMMKR